MVYDWPRECAHSCTRNRLGRGTKTIIKMTNTDSISDAIMNVDRRNLSLIKYSSLIIYTSVCSWTFPFMDLEIKSRGGRCWSPCILMSPHSWGLTCKKCQLNICLSFSEIAPFRTKFRMKGITFYWGFVYLAINKI